MHLWATTHPPVLPRNHTHFKSTLGKGSQHPHWCDPASCYNRAEGGPLLCMRDPWATLWIGRPPGSRGVPRGLCRRQEAPGREEQDRQVASTTHQQAELRSVRHQLHLKVRLINLN